MDKKSRLKQLAQTLLASTCLTAATTASASTVDESMIDGGFPQVFSNAFMLPVGTTVVTGSFCGDCGDAQAWFSIPGLTPGDTIQVTGSLTGGGPAVLAFGTFNQGDGSLGGESDVPSTSSFDVTAPSGGVIVFEAAQLSGAASGVDFEVAIADLGAASSSAPEPGTAAMGALGLATAAALRRKLKKA